MQTKKTEVTTKQMMTFTEKGQIFSLSEAKKSLASISCTTGFGIKRIKHLIEACKNTGAWKDAIKDWRDYVTEQQTREAEDRNTKKTINRRSYATPNRDTTQRHRTRKVKRVLSESVSRLGTSGSNTSGSGRGKRTSRKESLIESLRNHVDYKGE